MHGSTVHFKLTLAAPLHIGCGELYEPTNFVVEPENRELVTFAPADFLGQLTSDELAEFSAICSQGTVDSIKDLYLFMHRHRELARGQRVAATKDFIDHYAEVLEKSKERFRQELNQFAIARTAFNPLDNQPIIPGSSLKGAMRTAFLNARNKNQSSPSFQGKKASLELQGHLLGYNYKKIPDDPFRHVKISDFVPVGEAPRKIIYAVDIKKKFAEQRNADLCQILEIVEPGAQFWGSITVLSPLLGEAMITLEQLKKAAQGFYGFEKDREDRELATIKASSVQMSTEADNLPLRLGRHSGAECVTVAGHRQIRISPPHVKPPKISKHGATTVWLASSKRRPASPGQLQPMGWVNLAMMSSQELEEAKTKLTNLQLERRRQRQQEQEQQARLEEERQEKLRQKEALQLAEQQKQAAAKDRQEAEKARWVEMTEFDRDICCVRRDEIALCFAANDANDPLKNIWPKIDQLNDDQQKNLAKAFRERWQAENRWGKKDCSPKQWKKVQKVKNILNES